MSRRSKVKMTLVNWAMNRLSQTTSMMLPII